MEMPNLDKFRKYNASHEPVIDDKYILYIKNNITGRVVKSSFYAHSQQMKSWQIMYIF